MPVRAFQKIDNYQLAGESFGPGTGPLNGETGGFGWAGPWQTQNADLTVPGDSTANQTLLSYPGIAGSGNYATGGISYETTGRLLDTSASGAFSGFLANQLIGVPGQTLFFGLLMRKDVDSEDPMSVTLHPSEPPWWVNTSRIAIGYFGDASDAGTTRYWSLMLDGVVYLTAVPVIVGQTAFLVVEITFGVTTTVALYAIPPLNSLETASFATATTANSMQFQSVAFYGGPGASECSIGELHFAATYSALVSGQPPPPPLNLTGIAGNATVTLSWTQVPGANQYLIFQVVNGIAQLEATVTTESFIDTGLINRQSYTYFVEAVSSSGTSAASGQVTTVPRGAAPQSVPGLGTNLTQVEDYNRGWPFLDAFKAARPWISQLEGAPWGAGPSLQVDTNEWIKALQPNQFAETIMFDNALNDHADYPAGQYTLPYDGSGTLSFDLQSATILSQTPGRMAVNVPPGLNGIFLIESATDPGNRIRNIRFILPGFENTYQSQPFHPLFLSRLHGYKVLRFMEWMMTNGSTIQSWSDRAAPADYTYCWRGVPLEVMMQLANTLNVNPWFNTPAQANDNYVSQFAALISRNLSPALHFYIEYSNETWNSQFSQAAYIQNQGRALGLSIDPTLNGAFYTEYRAVQIFQIFQAAPGNSGQIIRVIASEASDSCLSNQTLGFHNAFANADVLAVAPYFNCSDEATGGFGVLGVPSTAAEVAAMTIDQVNSIQLAHVTLCALQEIRSNAAVASSYGLRLVAYEGGQSLVGYGGAENNTTLTNLFANVNRGAGMTPLYAQYLQEWVSAGGDIFVHYSDMGAYGQYGDFGALEYQDQDPTTSPKYQALMTFMAQHP